MLYLSIDIMLEFVANLSGLISLSDLLDKRSLKIIDLDFITVVFIPYINKVLETHQTETCIGSLTLSALIGWMTSNLSSSLISLNSSSNKFMTK